MMGRFQGGGLDKDQPYGQGRLLQGGGHRQYVYATIAYRAACGQASGVRQI
jgi:hypothetical protein